MSPDAAARALERYWQTEACRRRLEVGRGEVQRRRTQCTYDGLVAGGVPNLLRNSRGQFTASFNAVEGLRRWAARRM
jgi:hypothetical protein